MASIPSFPTKIGARAARAAPVLAAIAGIAVFSLMDATVKRASLLAGVYMTLLLRTLVSALLAAPLWRLSGGRWPGAGALRVHAVRGLVNASTAASFFWGLLRTPMAEGIALSFIAPVVALWLAAVILGERVRWPAIAAAVLGLAGVAVIAMARVEAGHGGAHAGVGLVAILGSAALYAWNLILQRQQAQVAGPTEVALFQSLFVALSLALLAPWLARLPPLGALGWIGASGVLALLALMLVSWAWGRAEAQVLLSIEYTAFVWAALFGWLMFGEAVTAPVLVGVALILLGCWLGTRGQPTPAHTEQAAL